MCVPGAPERVGVVWNEGGRSEAWGWDLATGERRRASEGGVGAEEVHLAPDGSGIVWWFDAIGDEHGRWMITPFEGGEAQPLLSDVPDGWAMGISMVPGAVAVGVSTEDAYEIWTRREDEPSVRLYRHSQPAGVGCEWPQGEGGLSADGSLLCIRHAERGDISRQALRVLDARTGESVGETGEIEERTSPAAWSPVPGDQRLVIQHERSGLDRPALWNLSTGEREDIELPELPGAAFAVSWWPDASSILVRHGHEGYDQLWRLDLTTRALTPVSDPRGTIYRGWVRPDGEIWAWVERSVAPGAIVRADDGLVFAVPGEPHPPGRPYRSFWFENPRGERIQAFEVTPDGDPPFPTILLPHGGPEWHHTDAYSAHVQALVDHGFAVLLVNYRGSTGYGATFRDAIRGNIGFPESEDINAALDRLIADGVADPDRLFLEGWSWGGYLATLNAGLRPERWRAVCAGIPVGDYVAAHYESAPALRASDIAVMGGSPMDLPDLYRERNPMTYVESVRAPMLIIAGENDSRCPLGQVMTYAHALAARKHPVEVHLYAGGHHANEAQEQIRHVELIVDFFRRHGGT